MNSYKDNKSRSRPQGDVQDIVGFDKRPESRDLSARELLPTFVGTKVGAEECLQIQGYRKGDVWFSETHKIDLSASVEMTREWVGMTKGRFVMTE